MSPSRITAIWPGGPGFSRRLFRSTDSGEISNDSEIYHDLHVGTHIESGFHRSSSGEKVGELLPRSVLFLKAQIIDARASQTVSAVHVGQIAHETEFAMFLTDNSTRSLLSKDFTQSYVGLDKSAAEALSDLDGLRIVGIDYISIETFQGDGSVHQTLFDQGLLALETLDLRDASPGNYVAVVAAQILDGAEAAQCQVAILEESDVSFLGKATKNLPGVL